MGTKTTDLRRTNYLKIWFQIDFMGFVFRSIDTSWSFQVLTSCCKARHLIRQPVGGLQVSKKGIKESNNGATKQEATHQIYNLMHKTNINSNPISNHTMPNSINRNMTLHNFGFHAARDRGKMPLKQDLSSWLFTVLMSYRTSLCWKFLDWQGDL